MNIKDFHPKSANYPKSKKKKKKKNCHWTYVQGGTENPTVFD